MVMSRENICQRQSMFTKSNKGNERNCKNYPTGDTVLHIKDDAPLDPRDYNFLEERWKCLIAVSGMFVTNMLMSIVFSNLHNYHPRRKLYPPLPDIVLDWVHFPDHYLSVAECLLIITGNVPLIIALLHKQRFIIIRRYFVMLSIIYLYRSLTIMTTLLPIASPTVYCSPQNRNSTVFDVLYRSYENFGLGLNAIFEKDSMKLCGDYIFSGHTATTVLNYLFTNEYIPKQLYLFNWFVWMTSVTSISLVLLSRIHYTIDIILAYYISTRVFWMYNAMANNLNMRRKTEKNPFCRLWWFKMFIFFERNVECQVPRISPVWSFSWHKRFRAKNRHHKNLTLCIIYVCSAFTNPMVMSQSDTCQWQSMIQKSVKGDESNFKNYPASDSASYVKEDAPMDPRDYNFLEERWKCLIAVTIMFFSNVLMTLAQAYLHNYHPSRKLYAPLPDIVLDLVSFPDYYLQVSEYLLVLSGSVMVFVGLLHKQRFILLRRYSAMLSIIFLHRTLTIMTTFLPITSPTIYCSPQNHNDTILNILYRSYKTFGFGLHTITGTDSTTHCGDYIFSGHTACTVLNYLFTNEYMPKELYLLNWFVWMTSVTCISLLVLSRGHYTIDAILAYYLSTRVFWMYNAMANNLSLRRKLEENPFCRLWWFKMFLFFERNVECRVPRLLPVWPFSWSRSLQAKNRDHKKL